jgi:hypothetical protein
VKAWKQGGQGNGCGGGFGECFGDMAGRHTFLYVEYPNYRYDAFLGEHGLVCDEGEHTITFIPPDFEEGEDGIINIFCWLKLDDGVPRAFSVGGYWDPAGSEKVNLESAELYGHCTAPPWVDSVTLFAEGYDNLSEAVAENEDRMILTYDDIGEEVKEYYQRGLRVSVLPNNFDNMPTLTTVEKTWDVLFHSKPDCMEEDDPSDWSEVDLGVWYQAPPCLDITYCRGADVVLEYKYTGEQEHNIPCMVLCQFKFGAEEEKDEEKEEEKKLPENVWFGSLFHIPGIEILTSSDGENYEQVYSADTMTLAMKDSTVESKSDTYKWAISLSDFLGESKKYVMIKFRTTPTDSEIDAISGLKDYYYGCSSVVCVECIYIYCQKLCEATETIYTYERLYNISYGKHGDFPPHGYDNTGSCLYPSLTDASTVYQDDTIAGVRGMSGSNGDCVTMNKCRGRILFECHADKEPLNIGVGGSSNWLYKAEQEQKIIHDAIRRAGKTTFKMKSICPPGLDGYLKKVGVTFPSWYCYFINSIMLALSPVIPRGSYSAEGHYFDWDFENMEYKLCGRLFARFYANVFRYVYRDVVTGTAMWDSMDAIAAYLRVAGSTMVNPMNYIAADASRADQLQENIRAFTTQENLFTVKEGQVPPPIDPLY